MATQHHTATKPPIHPVWMLLALPSMLLLLGSDAGNNLSIVHRFASGELSLWSWQGLALGAAIASAPLGYASGIKQWMIAPTAVVVIIGGVLTLMSTNTDFKGKSVDAQKYQADFAALNAERANLIESLRPTDGSVPCSKQRWCDSQAKEQRLAQINTMTNFVDTTVDPLATPGGKFFSQLLAYLRAFGVPAVVAALAHCLGLMFHKKVPHSEGTPPGRKRITDYDWQGPKISPKTNLHPITANAPDEVQAIERTHKPTAPTTQGSQRDTGTFGKAKNRYSELRKSVLSGRTRPSLRQVREFCGCNQEVAQRYLSSLADEGVIVRTESGRWQLQKLRAVK